MTETETTEFKTGSVELSSYIDKGVAYLKEILKTFVWKGSTSTHTNIELKFSEKTCRLAGQEYDWEVRVDKDSWEPRIYIQDSGQETLRTVLQIDRLNPILAGVDWAAKVYGTCEFRANGAEEICRLRELERWAKVEVSFDLTDRENGIADSAFINAMAVKQFKVPYFNAKETFKLHEFNVSHPAIVIVGFDRPEFIHRTITALKKNPQFWDWPVYVFLDAPLPEDVGRKVDCDKVYEIVKRQKPQGEFVVIRRDRHYGCGRNLIDARHQVFDVMGHSRAYVFEDDLEVSPSYLSLCENLWRWVERRKFSNVGVVQGWEYSHISSTKADSLRPFTQATFSNLWGYSMSRDCWNRISPFLMAYLVEQLDTVPNYESRNHKLIGSQISKFMNLEISSNSSAYPVQQDYDIQKINYLNNPSTGQDGVTISAIYAAGLVRISTKVSRARYIGRSGSRADIQNFDKNGFSNLHFGNYSDDNCLITYLPEFYSPLQEIKAVVQDSVEVMLQDSNLVAM